MYYCFDTGKAIGSKRVKFADNGTIGRKGKDVTQIGQLLKQGFIKILDSKMEDEYQF